MNKLEIATLSLRLLSIYFLFKILDQADNVIYFIANLGKLSEGDLTNYLMAIVPAILYFTFGMLLWFSSPRIAKKIFSEDAIPATVDLSLENIQLISFSVAGFFLLSNALPQLSELFVYNFLILHYEGKAPFKAVIVVACIKIALGIWLLLGSKGIVNFIKSLRREKTF